MMSFQNPSLWICVFASLSVVQVGVAVQDEYLQETASLVLVLMLVLGQVLVLMLIE